MDKKILIITLLFFSIYFVNSLDVPVLKGYVNDYADMISSSVESELETKLKAFEDSDSTQIVILTISSLEEESLEEFSIKVAETWKIGQKNKDNGAIFLVSKNDRKMRIEVGYGLEGVITDLLAGRIIDHITAPHFQNGDMDKGFTETVNALIGSAKGEFTADKLPSTNPSKQKNFPISIIVIITMFWFGFSKIFPLKIRGFAGGIFGIIIFLILGFIGGMALGVFSIIILSILGSVVGAILTLLFTAGNSRGGSSGGYFSSGSSGGFSSSGGSSFSGGGGSFGGGGSSGSW